MKKFQSSLLFFVFLFPLINCQFHAFAQSPHTLLYVGNSGNNTISVIDTNTNSIIHEIAEDIYTPEKLFITPDKEKVYSISSGAYGRRVTSIMTDTHTVLTPQVIGGGNQMVFSLTSQIAFLSLLSGDYVKLIYTDTDGIHYNHWELDDPVSAMSVKPDGGYVYVDNYYDRDSEIWAYEMSIGYFIKTPISPLNIPSYSYHHIRDIGQSPTKDEMYITSGSYVQNDWCSACDQYNYGFLNVYDTQNNQVLRTITIEKSYLGDTEISSDGQVACISDVRYNKLYIFNLTDYSYQTVELAGKPRKILFSQDNSTAYLLQHELDRIDLIDLATATFIGSIPVGDGPYDMLLLPHQPYIYVTNQNSDSVSVIDTNSNTVVDNIPVGVSPKPIVAIPPNNYPPIIDELSDPSISEGDIFNFTISATDPDGDSLIYSASNIPTGASFDPETQVFSWVPGYDQSGIYNVLFVVTDDGVPPMAASQEVTISVGNVNRPPEIEPIEPQQAYEGDQLYFIVNASDPDGDELNLSAGNLPIGASLNLVTGEFTWSPGYDQQGNHYVTFSISDYELTVSEQVLISVNNVNRPPVLTPIGNKEVNEGETLAFVVSAIDPDQDVLIFSADNLPVGATFDPDSQTFSWVPFFDQEGVYNDIEFSVVDVPDGDSSLEVDSELITISVGNSNRAPIFTSIGTQTVLENQQLLFGVSANDPDGDAIFYTHSELPYGASFNGTQFIWTPNNSQAGSYPVSFFATDDGIPPMTGELGIVINVGDVPTPCELSDQIIATIDGYDMPKAIDNSYMANLKKVCQFVEKGKIKPAINQLNAFEQKVEQDIAHGAIVHSEGSNLIDMSNSLRGVLQN